MQAGLPLIGPISPSMSVRTNFPPLAKFAAPFGIVELNSESAIPITLRNVEPRVKARQLNPDEPPKIMEKPKDTRDSVIDKARAVGEKLTSWFSGSKKNKEKG